MSRDISNQIRGDCSQTGAGAPALESWTRGVSLLADNGRCSARSATDSAIACKIHRQSATHAQIFSMSCNTIVDIFRLACEADREVGRAASVSDCWQISVGAFGRSLC